MPGRDSCCAVGCGNWRGKAGCETVKFYRIPKAEEARLEWIARINRADLRLGDVTDNTRLCSAHFHNGIKSSEQPLPVQFAHQSYPLCRKQSCRSSNRQPRDHCQVRALKRRHCGIDDELNRSTQEKEAGSPRSKRASVVDVDATGSTPECQSSSPPSPNSDSDPMSLADRVCQLDAERASLLGEISQLQTENISQSLRWKNQTLEGKIARLQKPGIEETMNEEMFSYYTGLPSKESFNNIMALIHPELKYVYSESGVTRGPARELNEREECLLVLMRLRLGLQERDLQYRFKLRHHTRVSKKFQAWVPFLARVLQPLMPWPSRKDVQRNMPHAFKSKKKYHRVRAILDCAEFEMEVPSALSLNAMHYSDYKGRHTVKVLFAVTPDGYISFVSSAYPGSITDNSITCKSGFLSLLQSGDDMMADKGFTVSNTHLEPRGLKLVVPPFRKNKAKFSAAEVATTKVVANLRIVVENCILRTRYFRILLHRLPVASIKSASDIVNICAILTNLRCPLRPNGSAPKLEK